MQHFIKASFLSAALLTTSALGFAASGDQVTIEANEQHVRINIVEANGRTMDIELDIDESTSGEVTKAVLASLKEKGIVVDGDGDDSFHITLENGEELGELEGLNVLQSLKLLKGLEILQELEALKDLDGNAKISIDIEVEQDSSDHAAQ